jgi:hypothetical protein
MQTRSGKCRVFAKFGSSHGALPAPFLSQQELISTGGSTTTWIAMAAAAGGPSKQELKTKNRPSKQEQKQCPKMSCCAPCERKRREREREGERNDAVFVLLNPYSAAVYCRHVLIQLPR